ncbi:MAG: ABC transporter permease [Candidatus Sumerlaeaceae bacterium]|nr:ABC transporter permease [Candidatus Sumerlaeaceae bacterium]
MMRRGSVRGFWLASWTLYAREVTRFFRQPSRVVGALGTPLLFWVLIGSGVGDTFRPAGGPAVANYLAYFLPGAVVLTLLFTAIFSTISIIEDRREGFMQAVLAAPVSRGSIVMGKLLGGATLATIQGFLLLLVGPAVGLSPPLGAWLAALAVMFLVGFSLTGFGFCFAWRTESVQGFHAVMNLLMMPMWILSGALFPAAGAAAWVRVVMGLNPLSYGLDLLRAVLHAGTVQPPGGMALALGVSILFAAVMFVMSWSLVCKPTTRPA